MKKWILIGVIVIIIASGVLAINYIQNKEELPINPGNRINSNGGSTTPAVQITYENLPDYLAGNAVVKDLPEDSTVLLRFYNFDSGTREWEKSFILTKGGVEEGYIDNADLVLFIHSKYLDQWTNRNFCTIMSNANKNGDLGYESSLSSVKLAWKFKSLNSHKSCFGL